MAKKQFKSESKRLLDLMINSIYTHKEIFLRELISNASDAIDKLCYISLTDDKVPMTREDYNITISTDKEARTLTISDNGVGMTAQELESNLGVIARSGSLKFRDEMEEDVEDIDIIGQFGVGFYSAFMVAREVIVKSRSYGNDDANQWVSQGSDGYSISPCEKETIGTEIIISLKEDTDDEKYSDYLEEYKLQSIIKKYSDYIRWPIVMDLTKSRQVESGELDDEGNEEMIWESYTQSETINSRIPIWQRSKSEVSDEDCAEFYKEKFSDYTDPASVIRVSAEGTVSYQAMLFIPSVAPFDYFTREYKAGLQLYSSGVMIMEHCADILPEYFRFVRGVVDSQDFSLNISRELLQHDRQLKVISTNVEKKIKTELKRLMDEEREKYESFYNSFGVVLKYGIAGSYGTNTELLSDLIMLYSSKNEKLISIGEYVESMSTEQKYIYYASGESIALLDKLPQGEQLRDMGYDILYLTEEIDEFVVRSLGSFNEVTFRSVNDDDLELEDDEDKEEISRQEDENREVLDFIKEALEGKVESVKISSKLKSHPVSLSAQGGISLEMEKYFKSMQSRSDNVMGDIRAERVLELNPSHSSFSTIKQAYDTDKDKAAKYAKLLYGQALLTQGVPLEDPAGFSELISELTFS
ncbi:MAG: molecular chaperone HtpG [Oscillospiraceae bacterium]|nr:molecular chaperone HtpG [Oscillospiraceae bacterium]